ncbi:uncharacterized protein BDZ99DRAFT_483797 [Mytilinidion resinicola]|uniref:Uncharacterized protein n=1 Tax=Mytilinidion resinicola TaxID=574789 RepID=A0A6A6XXN1_9PEZI|nr:uncharacterized protein BDZ99DRAFT_483797 [Mytilinidion resinicola]KAF2801301.1 hypothetical protein BDZ99DRAFT_483797 [Mytilinidion resinicola]
MAQTKYFHRERSESIGARKGLLGRFSPPLLWVPRYKLDPNGNGSTRKHVLICWEQLVSRHWGQRKPGCYYAKAKPNEMQKPRRVMEKKERGLTRRGAERHRCTGFSAPPARLSSLPQLFHLNHRLTPSIRYNHLSTKRPLAKRHALILQSRDAVDIPVVCGVDIFVAP